MGNETMTAEATWQALLEGNRRYVAGTPLHPHQTIDRRNEVTAGQHPFAIVLSCSDSRVPVEILFDQGIGDIFVVRTAGNIVDDIAIGSIEYAAEHLHVPLLVVLGHQKCGAIAATAGGGEAPGHIASIVQVLNPIVEGVRGQPGDIVENAVHANVRHIVAMLRSCQPILAHLVQEGHLKIVGAYYNLETGAVSLVE